MFSIELKLTNLWCKLDLLSNNQIFEKPVIPDKESKCDGDICSKN